MLRMVPLPRHRGGGCKQSRSRDAIRTRVIVTQQEILRSPPRSSPENAGGGHRYPHDLRFEPRSRRKESKEAERRQTRILPPHLSGAARAERCALASRRSTTALCQWDYSSQGSTWARLRDTRGQTRRVPRQPVWHFQRCTSRAGHSAGRLMPRPPGSDGDEPPSAGTVSRSAGQSH
jgi:hypothetical protein